MMLGYYDCTALAELLSNRDRLLDTVEEAVRLLARTAEASATTVLGSEQQQQQQQQQQSRSSTSAAREETLLPSAETYQPPTGSTTNGKGASATREVSDAEVERVARKRLFEHADWPENYTNEDRQRLRSAVRMEMSGGSGHWISSTLLQVLLSPSPRARANLAACTTLVWCC
jgi:hypothetical protein